MRERPIPFKDWEVRAILGGRKSQTRRVIKRQPQYICTDWNQSAEPGDKVIYRGQVCILRESHGRGKRDLGELTPVRCHCPYGVPGDRLWVKETWCRTGSGDIHYRATQDASQIYAPLLKWKSSMMMPRWVSRILLEVLSVRVQRLQDISEGDVNAEGIEGDSYLEELGTSTLDPHSARIYFMELWDSINAKRGYSWESNPYVRVIEFKRLKGE